MKTEKEYADELVDYYHKLLYQFDRPSNSYIHCAINDVTNTIKAMSQMKLIFSDRELVLKYYKTVLQILKERL